MSNDERKREDDLVKRLRDLGDHAAFEPHMHHTAADRITELEAKLANMEIERLFSEEKLAKAVEALAEAVYLLDPDDEDVAKETGLYRIVTTLASLKGETDA